MRAGVPGDIVGLGYLHLRDIRPLEPRRYRNVICGALLKSEENDVSIGWVGTIDSWMYAEHNSSPDTGGVFQEIEPNDREVSKWAPAIGVTLFGGEGDAYPIYQGRQLDGRYKKFVDITGRDDTKTGVGSISSYVMCDGRYVPDGTQMILLPGTQDNSNVIVAYPQHQIVASNRDENHFSSIVFDCKDGALDNNKAGMLHSFINVTHTKWHGDVNVPSFNCTNSTDGTGFGSCFCKGEGGVGGVLNIPGVLPMFSSETPFKSGMVSYLSWERGGFLHPGHLGNDKHVIDLGDDGPETSAHIWCRALFFGDETHDAPLYFEYSPHEDGVDYDHITNVHLRIDNNLEHPWYKGLRTGAWRWTASTLFSEPEIEEEPKTVIKKKPEPEGELIAEGDNFNEFGDYETLPWPNPNPNPGGNPGAGNPGAGNPGNAGNAGGNAGGNNGGNNAAGGDVNLISNIYNVPYPWLPTSSSVGINKPEESRVFTERDSGYTSPLKTSVDRIIGLPGDRIQPATSYRETCSPSMHLSAIRNINRQAYDGRFGGRVPELAKNSPVTISMQGFGECSASGVWEKTTPDIQSKDSGLVTWKKGTADGGIFFSPPEIFLDGQTPVTKSNTKVVFEDSIPLVWGTPNYLSLIPSGYAISIHDAALNFEKYDANGAVADGLMPVVVNGTVAAVSIALSGLTDTYVPVAGVGGLLANSGMTYAAAAGLEIPNWLNVGTGTAVATGDLSAGDGTRTLLWDASAENLGITGTTPTISLGSATFDNSAADTLAVTATTKITNYTEDFVIEFVDNGVQGPTINLYHNSSSPDINDVVASINGTGTNDASAIVIYGQIDFAIDDETSATEAGRIDFYCQKSASLSKVLTLDETSIHAYAPESIVEFADDGALGPVLKLYQKSASPAALDVVARIDGTSSDSDDNETTYSRIDFVITDPTADDESGEIQFWCSKESVLTKIMTVDEDGVNIPGKLTVGGLIDPTGLVLEPVATNPGDAHTLWEDSDDDQPYYGSQQIVRLEADGDLAILAADTTEILFVDKSESKVGINDNAPTSTLDVTGDINCTTGYKIGDVAGIDKDVSFVDGTGFTQNFTFTKGILTAHSVT